MLCRLNRLKPPSVSTRIRMASPLLSPLSRPFTSHTAGICVIGDEVLNGKTIDTNSQYLAKWCFERGIDLRRIEVVPDDKADIGESVHRLANRFDVVYTCGGIGPTHDDITYESIAAAFDLPMAMHEPTWTRMRANPRLNDVKLTEEDLQRRRRMAWQPSGPNVAVHFASDKHLWTPVVVINEKVHILPGVPVLFRRLLEVALPAVLKNDAAISPFYRLQIGTERVESQIADILKMEQADVRGSVKIGSYPCGGPMSLLSESKATAAPVVVSVPATDGEVTTTTTITRTPRVIISLVGQDKSALDACLERLMPAIDGFIIEAPKPVEVIEK